MSDRDAIRRQVLRGIALNRQPGFHFPGNLLELCFERRARGAPAVSLLPGPHCVEPDGQTNLAAVAMAADLALAASVRANLDAAQRLATVSMHLQFTGAPLAGRLVAQGAFERFLSGAGARQGLARFTLDCAGARAAFGTGTFMVLRPPKGVTLSPVVARRGRRARALRDAELDAAERAIVARAEALLARPDADRSFISRFWSYLPRAVDSGAHCHMENGPHAGNRVGHTQGGLLVGLAACTSNEALGPEWLLSAVTASYVGPGEGATLYATSRITHRGGQTAVVRTAVTAPGRRAVLDVMTTHARRG